MFLIYLMSALLLLLAGHLAWLSKPRKDMKESPVPSDEEVKKHIVWMFFYCNPDDPRGWVGKTHGPGITPNFRTKDNILIFISLIVAIQVCAMGLAIFLIMKSMG